MTWRNESDSSHMTALNPSRLVQGLPSETNVETSHLVHIKEAMLDRIAKSDAFFKHQQRGDPDLAYTEKFKIAKDLLENKTTVFLTRYHRFLEVEDLEYFDEMSSDYVIGFHLNEIKQRLTKFADKTIIRNRRYEAMKVLIEEGEYFGDEELKHRDPLLYEQMVGQYLDDNEINAQVDKSDLRFSSILLKNLDMTQNNALYRSQVEMEANQMIESDEKEEDEDDDESELESDEGEDDVEALGPNEKQMLRNEFIRIMQLRFLNGEDKEFDYSKIDRNVEYDSLDIRERDEQEKYFDAEDPESIEIETDMLEKTSGFNHSKMNIDPPCLSQGCSKEDGSK